MKSKSPLLNFLFRAGTILLGFILLAVICGLCNYAREAIFPPTQTPTRPPTATPITREKASIFDFLAAGKIRVETKGAGIDEINMLISKLVEEALEVEIPIGTMFVSETESVQRMVTRRAVTIYLDTDIDIDVDIDVACADYWKDVPHAPNSFPTILPPADDELTRVLETLAAAEDFDYRSYSVTQAAVWIITSDSSYDGLGQLVSSYGGLGSVSTTRMIHEKEAARAMYMIHQSGTDIRTKRIWEDHDRILQSLEEQGVENQTLIDWLRSLQ